MKLIIEVKHPSETEPGLMGFPFIGEQHIEMVQEGLEVDTVIIDLLDRSDTTAAQEQFLNTHPGVIRYFISDAVADTLLSDDSRSGERGGQAMDERLRIRELECIESAARSSGQESIEWSLEAIAIALHRIADAIKKAVDEIELERERQDILMRFQR